MNKYLYSLLLLAALTNQLQSMDGGYWLGEGQEELERAEEEQRFNDDNLTLDSFKEFINNNNSQYAINEVNAFFLDYDTDYVQRIMNNDLTSPLLLAVEANDLDVVNFIVEHQNFINLPNAANNLQTALQYAQELNHNQIRESLQRAAQFLEDRVLEDLFNE
ncbi:MAG: hypothetical protein EBU90_21820 [Proteobacteria bacterium]|nr:hypothetical protein [Pseudomonadota bacterium]